MEDRNVSGEIHGEGDFKPIRRWAPAAIARAAGLPYDPERLDPLQRLHAELAGASPVTRFTGPTDGPALPFFEAYFSNFIEGTEFAVDEAADIALKRAHPEGPPGGCARRARHLESSL